MIFLRVLAVCIFIVSVSAQANVDEGQSAYEAGDYLSPFNFFS